MIKEADKKPENRFRQMNAVSSVEEIGDPSWASSGSATTAMNRSDSEWFLQQYLDENFPSAAPILVPSSTLADSSGRAVSPVGSSSSRFKRDEAADGVEVLNNDKRNHYHKPPSDHPYPTASLDPDEYHALLKSKLHMACAVVAQMGSCSRGEENGDVAETQSKGSKPSQLGSPAPDKGAAHNISMAQSQADGGPLGIPALPAGQMKSGVQVVQATSGSSREDSDDDELEGDIENTENMDPTDEKRARRMRSNRESARRSRRKKQAHLNELETQVGQLRAEHSTLLKRLSEVKQKYEDSGFGNRILKADIETLRTKVKMAEETVKRVTGLPAMNLAMATVPTLGMPFVSSPMIASAIPPNPSQFFHHAVPPVMNAIPHHQRLDSSFPSSSQIPFAGSPQEDFGGNRVPEMSSIECRAGLQEVQKQISPTMPGWDPELSHIAPNNSKQN